MSITSGNGFKGITKPFILSLDMGLKKVNLLSNSCITAAISGLWEILITSKVLDVRRRGATSEAYRSIRRKHAPAKAGGGAIACPPLAGRQSAGGGQAQPFGFAQGHEPVDWQMMP